jgi:tRNA-dihydrouridine synthase
MYEGQVDLDAFAWCVQNAKAPLVYSGDIFDLDSFLQLKRKFPEISRWMLGRGLLFSPFLAEILRKESNDGVAGQSNLFWDFHEDLKEQIIRYSLHEKNQLNKLKEYWRYFSQAFQDSENLFYRIAHTKDLKSFMNSLDEIRATAQWRAGLHTKESYRFMKA